MTTAGGIADTGVARREPPAFSQRAAAPYQNTFRVAGWKVQSGQNRKQVVERLAPRNGVEKNEFRPRKSHTKSRLGCRNCKRRKIKCDETRDGGCLKCRQHGIECDYDSDVLMESRLSTPRSGDSQGGDGIESPGSQPMILYQPSEADLLLAGTTPDGIVPYLESLTHFERFTSATIGSDTGQQIFRSAVLAQARQRDFLLQAVLGTAASHLAKLYDHENQPLQSLRFQKSAAYHWSHALPLYRKELSKEVDPASMDALITTCMLVGIYFFQSSSVESGKSFVEAPSDQRDGRLLWLSMQQGFGILLRRINRFIVSSTWFEVFMSASLPELDTVLDPGNERGMYAELLDLCGIGPDTSREDNCFLPVLHDLFALLKLDEISMTQFAQLMAFMGRLTGEFSDFLKQRDSRALVILVYWLALMHKLGMWWMKSRAASEGEAILEYLKDDPDPRVRKLLEWPTSTFNKG